MKRTQRKRLLEVLVDLRIIIAKSPQVIGDQLEVLRHDIEAVIKEDNGMRYTVWQRDEIVKAYRAGMPMKIIREHFDVSEETVYRWITKAKLPRRNNYPRVRGTKVAEVVE